MYNKEIIMKQHVDIPPYLNIYLVRKSPLMMEITITATATEKAIFRDNCVKIKIL